MKDKLSCNTYLSICVQDRHFSLLCLTISFLPLQFCTLKEEKVPLSDCHIVLSAHLQNTTQKMTAYLECGSLEFLMEDSFCAKMSTSLSSFCSLADAWEFCNRWKSTEINSGLSMPGLECAFSAKKSLLVRFKEGTWDMQWSSSPYFEPNQKFGEKLRILR